MNQDELLALINHAERDAVAFQGKYFEDNEKFLKYYLGEPFGDEMEGRSQVVSTDVQDVIESDMPSLARIFLGNDNILEFEATTSNPNDIAEAEEKTKYINWIIRNQKNSFKILHDWIKDAEIQKTGVVKYAYEEKEETQEYEYEGLSQEELTVIFLDLQKESDDIKIIGQDVETGSVKFRVKRTKKQFVVDNVPTEDFLISRNAKCKDTAELVGDRTRKTKGELIAEGFDEELVKSLAAKTVHENSVQKDIRFKRQGGRDDSEDIRHWTSHWVDVSDLYVLVDYDGDGIPERRHILKAGNQILVNEAFPIVPYAMMSAIAMPHNAIGRSRAEITMQTQRIKSVLQRNMLDNTYRVVNGRVVINDEETNLDDLLTVRPNGVVRTTNPVPANAVGQLSTPYIGQETLQVIQYMDTVRAASTGTMLANQGLESDTLYNETATRFEGVRDAGAAKVELVARVMAETGFKELYEGLAWLVSHYQDAPKEIRVLGKQLTVDPRMWRFEHHISSNVGLAAGDDETILGNMASILTIQERLQQQGSLLTDQKGIYNTLARITKAMGLARTDDFFNDPEQPEELLQAQNQQLQLQLQQAMMLIEQLQSNPLAEQERIRQQGAIAREQLKSQTQLQQKAMDSQQNELDRQQDDRHHAVDTGVELTKIEADTNKNVPGSRI